MLFKIKMDPKPTYQLILELINSDPFLAEHKDEIKSLINKGWTSFPKIVEYLKKKYNK